ncbi:avirulence protein [Duganella sp. BJB488]|nr:avirulence protein [Duganella sp. BJB475]RFP13225.1 avirulence protein [Duganella sp. BJB489]RFP17200.1 avirulence protein [Duganella sp. BJB488]RFP25373.1 avirulence protein [Duganella sp. BJB476]RFP31580.1 avirulence protein [Duganella sp. BJB480]
MQQTPQGSVVRTPGGALAGLSQIGGAPRAAVAAGTRVPLVALDGLSPAAQANRKMLGGAPGKVYVAIDSEFSADKDAELTARLVTLQAARDKLAPLAAGRRASAPALSKYLAGKLDHVLVSTAQFREMAKGAGKVDGNPAAFPVFIDAARGQLVVDVHQAFVAGDRLSKPAQQGLSAALGTQALGIQNRQWLPAVQGAERTLKAAAARGADLAPEPRPIRRRGALHLEHEYVGKEIGSTTRGADFYQANRHDLISGHQDWVEHHRHSYTHVNYLHGEAGANVHRKEIVVHRGLIDNRNGIPENSIAAIDNAYAHHYRSIEIDVQITADDVPVLMHDFTAGRMTADRDNRLVSHTSYREISARKLVIRNPASGDYVVTNQKVPAAAQALQHVLSSKPGMTVFLDCKEDAPETMIALLIDRPQFRPFTAVKLYGRTYMGGFPQLLGKLQQRYGIDPVDPGHKQERQALQAALKEIGLVPILSQGFLNDPALRKFFPPPAGGKAGAPAPAELADIGMAWLKSWSAMNPVVLEVVPTGGDTPEGQAMQMIRERLRAPADSYAQIPFSGSYRYEDFSVPQKDGTNKYYTWDVHGGITDVTDVKFADRRGTAGAFRNEAENILTDQPDEEVWAIGSDQTLDRGHTGYKLDLPPGTPIDLSRNADNRKLRVTEFLREKPVLDEAAVRAVEAGMLADRGG